MNNNIKTNFVQSMKLKKLGHSSILGINKIKINLIPPHCREPKMATIS